MCASLLCKQLLCINNIMRPDIKTSKALTHTVVLMNY